MKFTICLAIAALAMSLSVPAFAGSITTYQGTWLDGTNGVGNNQLNNSGMNFTATLTVNTNTNTYSLDFFVQNLNHTSTLNEFALQTFCCGAGPSFTIDSSTLPSGWNAAAGSKINNGNMGLGCNNMAGGVAGWVCASANTMATVVHLSPNGTADFKFAGTFQNVSDIGNGLGQFDLMINGLKDGGRYALSDSFNFMRQVPEPATLSVLGTALFALGTGLKRKVLNA
jgi:hypothetical protein